MSEPQEFICPGRYFGRYCSDEREFEYARILERDNKEIIKELKEHENYGEESRKLREEIDELLKELKEKGVIDIEL